MKCLILKVICCDHCQSYYYDLMKIVCRYRKTTTMNSVYELEKLVSNCSVTNSETSSTHETEITVVTLKAHPDDQTVIIVGTKNGDPNDYQDEKSNCLENMKYINKEKPYREPLQNQKGPTVRLISEVKNPLDEQPYGPSEGSNKNLNVNQDNIRDGQDFLLMNVNLANPEESLQDTSIEKAPKSAGKTSTKVSTDKEIEKNATSRKDWPNLGETDNQKWIIKERFTLLTKILRYKDIETLNANRTPIFKDFLSFVEQTRLRQIYYRLHQNAVKVWELQKRVDSQGSLLDKNLKLLCSDIATHLKKGARHNPYKHQKRPSSGPNV